ncbi:Homeobox-leucine zipper protein ATHB-15 [Camellia lanceoleosa]|uniref:Homeobox-leucine zipper protein ATHB-15 n=1 Tax=Camellia lanceoleosa TaxID=1840588 RepID=A0ACC0HCC9_9ERIC|nr:Homeobox-leucine zipper protein ATHB-15 [Camellia lanceoleosa]
MKVHTNLQVEEYYGAKGVDEWNAKSWEKEINDHDHRSFAALLYSLVFRKRSDISRVNVPPAILLRFLREHRFVSILTLFPDKLAKSLVSFFSMAVTEAYYAMAWMRIFVAFELIFALIDASFADDAPLLPSGFRIIPLDSGKEASCPNRTLDLASALEIGPAGNKESNDCAGISGSTRSVMTIAFEFVFESHMQENVASMARQYVRSIISSVQRVALALFPSHPNSHGGLRLPLGTPETNTLSQWMRLRFWCVTRSSFL